MKPEPTSLVLFSRSWALGGVFVCWAVMLSLIQTGLAWLLMAVKGSLSSSGKYRAPELKGPIQRKWVTLTCSGPPSDLALAPGLQPSGVNMKEPGRGALPGVGDEV